MPTFRVNFDNQSGVRLAGIMDVPDTPPKAFALFSHCFTCTKDLKAIVRVSRGLARHQIGVLRFDFTGLGDSQGDFSNSNFETNLEDIQAATHWLASEYQPPQLLVGHSLGGAAMMASVNAIPSARAICTIAAPSCTKHLAEFLRRQNLDIETQGQGNVSIGGRTHTIRNQMLESLRNFELQQSIQQITRPHLIFHSPADETLDYWHAEAIFEHSAGAKSLITLEDSDHLLVNRPDDVAYVADLIATWARRFLN